MPVTSSTPMSEKHTKAPNRIEKVLGTEIWAALIEGGICWLLLEYLGGECVKPNAAPDSEAPRTAFSLSASGTPRKSRSARSSSSPCWSCQISTRIFRSEGQVETKWIQME
jgi:hypothetical protein